MLGLVAFWKQHKLLELRASAFAIMITILALALHKTLLHKKWFGQTVASWLAPVEDFADLVLPKDDVGTALALDRKKKRRGHRRKTNLAGLD